jgi:hypothetical protein
MADEQTAGAPADGLSRSNENTRWCSCGRYAPHYHRRNDDSIVSGTWWERADEESATPQGEIARAEKAGYHVTAMLGRWYFGRDHDEDEDPGPLGFGYTTEREAWAAAIEELDSPECDDA